MNGEAEHYSLDQLCDEKRTLFDDLSETVCRCKQFYQRRSLAFKMRQNSFLRPDPAGIAYDAPLDPLVLWGEGNPLPLGYSQPTRRFFVP